MLGPNDHPQLPPEPTRPSRSVLTRPSEPVSEMRGKKLARAAPMLALAGDQLLLGGADVGAAQHQVGRQAGRHLGEGRQLGGRLHGRRGLRQVARRLGRGDGDHGRQQAFRDRLADQQRQQVDVLRAQALLLGARGLRAGRQRFGQPHVERRRGAVVKAQLGQAQRLVARAQRAFGQGQQLGVGLELQPGAGHAGDQADLRRFAGFLGRQVLRQCHVFQRGDAAEKVQLPRRHTNAYAVERRHAWAVAAGIRVGCRARAAGRATHSGELIRTADLVLRACLLNVLHRHAQVAVVLQRQLDDFAQLRVVHELLPRQVGGGNAAFQLRASRIGPGGADGRRGLLVLGHERAGGQ